MGQDWLGEGAHSEICVDRPEIEGKENTLTLDQCLSLQQGEKKSTQYPHLAVPDTEMEMEFKAHDWM